METFFDLIYDILDSKIDINSGLGQLERNYSSDIILSAEEDGYDVFFTVFLSTINKKIRDDLSKPIDLVFLKFLLDKGANPTKKYSSERINSFFSGIVISSILNPLKGERSLLEISKYLADEFSSVEETLRKKDADYMGFQELKELLEENIKEKTKEPIISFSDECQSQIIFGRKYKFEKSTYSDFLRLISLLRSSNDLDYTLTDFDPNTDSLYKQKIISNYSIIIGYFFAINDSFNGPSLINIDSLADFISKKNVKVVDKQIDLILRNANSSVDLEPCLYLVSRGWTHSAICKGKLIEPSEKKINDLFFYNQEQEIQSCRINGKVTMECQASENININRILEESSTLSYYLCCGYNL